MPAAARLQFLRFISKDSAVQDEGVIENGVSTRDMVTKSLKGFLAGRGSPENKAEESDIDVTSIDSPVRRYRFISLFKLTFFSNSHFMRDISSKNLGLLERRANRTTIST